MPTVLNAFAIEVTESGMMIVDADGSVYELLAETRGGGGALSGERRTGDGPFPGEIRSDLKAAAATSSSARASIPGTMAKAADEPDWDAEHSLPFEASGVHRTTGESVVLKGHLISRGMDAPANSMLALVSSKPTASPGMALLTEEEVVIRGEVRFGARTRFPLQANTQEIQSAGIGGAKRTSNPFDLSSFTRSVGAPVSVTTLWMLSKPQR